MWKLADKIITSRLLLGTAQYSSLHILSEAVKASNADIVTVSLRRQVAYQNNSQAFWDCIKNLGCHLLPNTAGCRRAEEAVTTAEMASEIFNTNWIKLEVIGDDYNLQPDPFEL